MQVTPIVDGPRWPRISLLGVPRAVSPGGLVGVAPHPPPRQVAMTTRRHQHPLMPIMPVIFRDISIGRAGCLPVELEASKCPVWILA
jgi:hypothetical protein